jgi:hypothetical protein
MVQTKSETEPKKEKAKKDDTATTNTLALLVTEFLFIVLPLIVLAIVRTYQKQSFELFHTSEWAMMSAILFGQTLIKTIAAAITIRRTVYWQRIVLLTAAIIVLGIVPSLLVLALVLVSDVPSNGLSIAQLILFLISVALFFAVGGAMQRELIQREEITNPFYDVLESAALQSANVKQQEETRKQQSEKPGA